VPELGPLGSVRGALCNERSYREHKTQSLDGIGLFCCRFLMQKPGMIYGYARVSTAAQDESGQVAHSRRPDAKMCSARRSPARPPTGRSLKN
jgi:hypothetical protein